MAIERVFLSRNADSALKLGQARAAAMCATFAADVPIYEYSARHIKKAVVGSGGAEKEQVQRMVRMILGRARARSRPTRPTRSPRRSATRTSVVCATALQVVAKG